MDKNKRRLKVERLREYGKPDRSRIRLKGRWLKDAGFGEGYVIISIISPGVMLVEKE